MRDNSQIINLTDLKAAVDLEMRRVLDNELLPNYRVLHEMMTYHLGWDEMGANSDAGGKRLRPIFLLLCCAAAGGDWNKALPAAAAVELLHNFSLIHDDIQDQSPLRHGRPSVWKKWNTALAINAGDTMFSLANLALLNMKEAHEPEVVIQAQKVMLHTCIQLTHGQHLDISNEMKDEISLESYLEMIEGKTAVLIGAAMCMGVIAAGADETTQNQVYQFGKSIGMTFQVIDDILGIWGETAVTGKSSDGDLMSRKLSLPILYGIGRDREFASRWRRGSFNETEIPGLAKLLEKEGAREYAESLAGEFTRKAMDVFREIDFNNGAGDQLKVLCEKLISRNY